MRKAGPMGRPFAFMAFATMTASRGQQRAACVHACRAEPAEADTNLRLRRLRGSQSRSSYPMALPSMTASRGVQRAACVHPSRAEPAEADTNLRLRRLRGSQSRSSYPMALPAMTASRGGQRQKWYRLPALKAASFVTPCHPRLIHAERGVGGILELPCWGTLESPPPSVKLSKLEL
jgi:hypothetical protein